MRKLSLVGLAGLALLAAGSANAADIAARPILKAPPPPPPAYNWSGFYVGGHIGGGWARQAWEEETKFGNGFGDVCHFLELDGGEPGPSTPEDPGAIAICPFDALANAPGSGFGQNGSVGSHNAIGFLGGVQAGFNWQQPGSHWVLGVEGQFSWSDLKGDHQNSISGASVEEFGCCIGPIPILTINTQGTINDRFFSNVRDVATIAGRIGITSDFLDRTLFYVKGGGAYARNNYNVTSQFSASSCGIILVFALPCDATNGSGSWSGNDNRWGWMVGAGLEFGLFGNWSAKIEYDYLGLGHRDVTLNGGLTANCTGLICGIDQTQKLNFARIFRIDENIQLVKVGLNYRFDWGSPVGPVSAGY
ncbi:MAG TPA: outer membrane beta-barrel protein [Xanthobacteraceae bacterium]|jgi:outer membrane immunogenic protein